MSRFNHWVSVGSVALFCFCGTADGAVVQWSSADGGNDHWYEAVFEMGGISWEEASDDAMIRGVGGGYLATITSEAENAFVFDLVDDPIFWIVDGAGNSQGPYLGGLQIFTGSVPDGNDDENWAWLTGEAWSYTNWDPLEPNDGDDGDNIERGIENNLQFFTRGNAGQGSPLVEDTWNDILIDFNGVKGYVVEWNVIPEPSAVLLLGLLSLGMIGVRQRRRP